jgi:hypothetical protein
MAPTTFGFVGDCFETTAQGEQRVEAAFSQVKENITDIG